MTSFQADARRRRALERQLARAWARIVPAAIEAVLMMMATAMMLLPKSSQCRRFAAALLHGGFRFAEPRVRISARAAAGVKAQARGANKG